MDLLETTLKVIENRSVAKENLTLFKQDLDQYEDYINALKDNLQETQAVSSRSTQTLEINNFTKRAFNENSKEAKILFGVIYDYTQQIRENICDISQSESSLYDLCNENAERLKKIENNFNNTLKIFDIMKKDLADKASKESSEIQEQINRLEAEYKECDEMWKHVMDQHEEKQKMLHSIKMDIEILEDDIELEVQQQDLLIEEKKQESRRKFEEVNNDVELRDKVIEIEGAILTTNKELQHILESKGEALKKLTASQIALDQIDAEYRKLESEMDDTENVMKQEIQKLESEIDLKQNLIKEKDVKISNYKSQECLLNKEVEEINSKLGALDEDLVTLQSEFTEKEKEFSEDNILEKITAEHESIVQNSEKLIEMIAANEIHIKSKQQELDALKSTTNPEIVEIKEKIQALEMDAPRKVVLDKELEEIDLRNKSLQQSVDHHQKIINDLLEQKKKVELEHQARQEDLQNILLQYETMVNEVRRLESLQQQNALAQKIRTFSKTAPQPIKPSLQTKPSACRKRGFVMDFESDGSVDGGERLSYAEFMAKKKMMKETKKHRRSSK